MKKTISILLSGLVIFFSCKKDIKQTVPTVAPKEFADSIFVMDHPDFTFNAQQGHSNTTPVDTAYYYKPGHFSLTPNAPLASTYEWYLRRTGKADSLLSTLSNPVITFPNVVPTAYILLIVKNVAGIDSVKKPFAVKNTPNGLIIQSIKIDTMSLINPATSTSWNGSGGANVFCQIYDNTISSIVMDTMNSTGWLSAPSIVANIFPVKTNLSVIPYTIKYPSTIKTFTISSAISGVSMLDNFKVRIYNKNAVGINPDLIGEVDLAPSTYFGGALPSVIYINNPSAGLYLKLSVQWN